MELDELKQAIKDLDFEKLRELIQFVNSHYSKRREQVAWERVHQLSEGDSVEIRLPEEDKLITGIVKRPKKTRALVEIDGQLMDIDGTLIQTG